jgi:hypothetical protein
MHSNSVDHMDERDNHGLGKAKILLERKKTTRRFLLK